MASQLGKNYTNWGGRREVMAPLVVGKVRVLLWTQQQHQKILYTTIEMVLMMLLGW